MSKRNDLLLCTRYVMSLKLFAALSVLVITGCAYMPVLNNTKTSGSDSPLIETLYQSTDCDKISRGGFIRVDDAVVLEDFMLPLGESTAALTTARVDFKRQQVLVVDFGASPSGGFVGGLVTNVVENTDGNAVVRVKIPEKESPDKRQTQNVSHVCTLYVMTNDFRTFEVRSQYDDLLVRF